MAAVSDIKPDIILNSPVGAKPAVYKWPLTYVSRGQKIDGAEEIVETIKWVAHEYPEFKPAIENLLPDQLNLRNYDCIKGLCDKYNKIPEMVLKMNKGTSVAPKTSSRASQGLLKHIIQQVYNYAVADPTELNKYSPFSSETYGETNFEFMAQLIEKNQFRPREQDIFIDLGSGVGHIVLQVAATVECKKCYGIEISNVPAGYAKKMEERFKFWMSWHGKTYTEFELFHGDFFDKKYVDIIKNANYILVNNYAFKPEVDHKLKQRFLDLKDGVQILSSKQFCQPKSRVTERYLADIGSIMKVVEIQPEQNKDTVSWTPKPLSYYLHTLDASPVEKFYEKKKRQLNRSTAEKGRPTKRRRGGRNSDSEDESDDNNIIYGPTTRRAWSMQINATNTTTNSTRASTESVKTISSRNNSSDTENYESLIESEENTTATAKPKESEISNKKERKIDTQTSNAEKVSTNQALSAQTRSSSAAASEKSEAKSCLDKKRDYAIKKTGSTNLLQTAPPSALYSISKPADTASGSSASRIPSIVIKVKPSTTEPKTIDSKLANIITAQQKTTENKPSEATKSAETHGKRLRQRKKTSIEISDPPQQAQQTKQTKTTPAREQRETTKKALAAKNAAKTNAKSSKTTTNVSSNSILSTSTTNIATATTTRGKKAQSTVMRASATKATASNKRKQNPAEKGSSLDLLHNKTVESVVGSAGYFPLPAPGCEDYNLKSITETPSIPRFIIKDLSMFVQGVLGPKMIEDHGEHLRNELESFARKLQQPGAKEVLKREIERERFRNRMLVRERDELHRDVKNLTDRIPRAMKVHCDDLGIKNTLKYIIGHLKAQLKKHQDLTAYISQLEAVIHSNQRTMNPPAAHSNSNTVTNQCLTSQYRNTSSPATLDLSLKNIV